MSSTALLIVTLSCATGLEAPQPVPFQALTPAIRASIDRLAGQAELETIEEDAVNLAGNAAAWLVSQVTLTARQEVELADAMHQKAFPAEVITETPPQAQRVLERLVREMPEYLKPPEYHFELVIVDKPQLGAFTLGGGRVYLTRPLLQGLLGQGVRGEAALAFVLAQQLGHTARLHCRRGWQLQKYQKEVKDRGLFNLLHTTVKAAGPLTYFLYSRKQSYEADCFAWQLCRNAHLDLEAALDAPRFFALQAHRGLLTDPDYRPAKAAPVSVLDYYLSEQPEALVRLRRLLLERDGLVPDRKEHGLFQYDAATGNLTHCGNGAIKADEAPLVFVHGMHGHNGTFRPLLDLLSSDPTFAGRPVLVFRFPSNDSLARSGGFLHREMARVVAAPGKAQFVCHSAGGLVFRYYAEIKKGAFDRAVLLATPNLGSHMTALKFLADLAEFSAVLKQGLGEALAATVPEGLGEIINDLHPDSLFLRYLGYDAACARRYYVFYGQALDTARAAALRLTFGAAKRVMKDRLFPGVGLLPFHTHVLILLDGWELPEEILRGDGVVSVRSARLRGARQVTKTTQNHLSILTNEMVRRQVLEILTGK
jgi:Zn-dependent protease with chaperone function